jgi:L-fuculose-phosphate aldolase
MAFVRDYAEQVKKFITVCGWLAANRFVTSSGGNLAWKLAADLLLITPTLMYKGDIQPEDVVFVNLAGQVLEGQRRPTGEMPMYLKFFKERPDIQSVIHCHPPHVCALAIRAGQNWLLRPLYPETVIEVGPVPVVPYAEPLTEKLAQNFAPFLPKYNSFMMENHGLVTLSRGDIRATLMLIDLLESTAQSLLLALMTGPLKELDRQAVIDLGQVLRTRNLPLMGAPGVNQSLEALYFD